MSGLYPVSTHFLYRYDKEGDDKKCRIVLQTCRCTARTADSVTAAIKMPKGLCFWNAGNVGAVFQVRKWKSKKLL